MPISMAPTNQFAILPLPFHAHTHTDPIGWGVHSSRLPPQLQSDLKVVA